MSLPPLFIGESQETLTSASPKSTFIFFGSSGTVNGIIGIEGADS